MLKEFTSSNLTQNFINRKNKKIGTEMTEFIILYCCDLIFCVLIGFGGQYKKIFLKALLHKIGLIFFLRKIS